MSTPDQRARDKDRDAAIEVVEAAWADGQIVQADRDKRVEELLRAQTLQDIDVHVRDLQRPGAPPTTEEGQVPPGTPVPADGFQVQYGAPGQSAQLEKLVRTGGGKAPRVIGLVVLIVVLAVVGSFVVGVVAFVRGISDVVSEATSDASTSTPLPGEPPEEGVNVLTAGGYRDFVEGVDRVAGSTEAFEAVLYPTYAVVYLPVDDSTQRQSMWYWNGTMDDLESTGTSTYQRFDLADVDPEVVVRLVKKVRGRVEDPTSFYAIVRAPDESDGSAIWAYASNEYSETAYLGATLDGRVVYDPTKVG